MDRLRHLRDTLGFDLALLAVAMPATVIALVIITSPGALS